jgi:hypothetical protein
MAKQKENAVVHSQEQLADGIYSIALLIFAENTIPTTPNGRQQHNVEIIDNIRYGTQFTGFCGIPLKLFC